MRRRPVVEYIAYAAFALFGAYVIFVGVLFYRGHKRQQRLAEQVRRVRGR